MASATVLPRPVTTAASGAPIPAAIVTEIAYEKMPVIDPLSNGVVSPVVFTDLPVASVEKDALEDGDADVRLYVPGSIGKAKRGWAGTGDGSGAAGTGHGPFVLVGGAGGHCPMPGRTPPVWK